MRHHRLRPALLPRSLCRGSKATPAARTAASCVSNVAPHLVADIACMANVLASIPQGVSGGNRLLAKVALQVQRLARV